MADNTVEGKRNKRDADTRDVAIESKNKLNQQDGQLARIQGDSYGLVKNQGELNEYLLEDRSRLENVGTNLNKTDK